MLTDEQIRTAFHDRAGTSVNEVTPPPDLLDDLRHQHRQRARVAVIGAPLAVIVLTAAAVLGVHLASGGGVNAGNDGPAAVVRPSASAQPPLPGPIATGHVVRLFDHAFTMPPGWPVTSLRHHAKARLPDTRVESVMAASGADFVTVVEYRGAYARARYRASDGNPGEPRLMTIAGKPGREEVTTLNGSFGQTTLQVLVTPRDSVVVIGSGVPPQEVEDIARAALHSSP